MNSIRAQNALLHDLLGVDLVCICKMFLQMDSVTRDVGKARRDSMLSMLSQPDCLGTFSMQLRVAIADAITLPGFNSEPYWRLMDAIGFYGDSVMGNWPYMQEAEQNRYMRWAFDCGSEVRAWIEAETTLKDVKKSA